jgi:tetratricopeptide (TPR) repeat protein
MALVAAARALAKEHRLAEAEALVARALNRAPRNQAVQRAAAAIAHQAGNMQTALARWAQLRAQHPCAEIGYTGALRTLRMLGRLDLAPPILDAGMANVGENVDFVAMAAQIAVIAKKFDQGAALWQRAVSLRPNNAEYDLSAALALIGHKHGRPKRMPRVVQLLERHHVDFPDHVPAFIAHINALRELRRYEDADVLASDWCARLPADLKLALARAGLQEDMGRFDLALNGISAIRARIDNSAELEAAFIRALSCAGLTEHAERVCATARQAYRGDRRIWLEYANLASRQADWTETVRRLREASQALPNDRTIAQQLRIAEIHVAEPEAESKAETAMPANPSDNLFDRFESLGGPGMGCEFGMVQARFDSHSVGLLRWARSRPADMVAAIECGFAGVGDEEHTEVRAVRGNLGHEEYAISDRRFLLESRTFVRTSDAPADRIFVQTCRRLRFLRGKLLEDMRAAENIFVYRCEPPIDTATAVAMHAALKKHGDNALLCVMRAHGEHASGTVQAVRNGLFLGYISHFALDPAAGTAGSDVAGWTAVCAAADADWRARR